MEDVKNDYWGNADIAILTALYYTLLFLLMALTTCILIRTIAG